MVLAIFDLQVTLMLPTKFQDNWPFGSGEEAKMDFQDGGHLGLLIKTTAATLLSTSHPDASNHVSSQLAFRFRRRSEK